MSYTQAKELNWQKINDLCVNQGKRLCGKDELCMNGNPIYGVSAGKDAWVAVNDDVNEWVQVGNNPHTPCTLHSDLGSKPEWGLADNNNYEYIHYKCCDKNNQEPAPGPSPSPSPSPTPSPTQDLPKWLIPTIIGAVLLCCCCILIMAILGAVGGVGIFKFLKKKDVLPRVTISNLPTVPSFPSTVSF